VTVVDDGHVGQEVLEALHERDDTLGSVVLGELTLAEDLAVLHADGPGNIEEFGDVGDASAEGRGLEGAVHEQVLVDEVEIVDHEDLMRLGEGVPIV